MYYKLIANVGLEPPRVGSVASLNAADGGSDTAMLGSQDDCSFGTHTTDDASITLSVEDLVFEGI